MIFVTLFDFQQFLLSINVTGKQLLFENGAVSYSHLESATGYRKYVLSDDVIVQGVVLFRVILCLIASCTPTSFLLVHFIHNSTLGSIMPYSQKRTRV